MRKALLILCLVIAAGCSKKAEEPVTSPAETPVAAEATPAPGMEQTAPESENTSDGYHVIETTPAVQISTPAVEAATAAVRPERYQAVLIRDYPGRHQANFASQFDRVRLLVHQAQLEASSRLGLFQYREGFKYPITVRFQDGAPPQIENALAYVQMSVSSAGFKQELVVNLDELDRNPMNFDMVFYHEMTHAVLSDAVGGQALLIPRWVHEGLAMYVSGEGDGRVKAAAENLRRSQVSQLIYPLSAPPTGSVYPQYYLAVKYMLDKHSVNAIQALIRNLVARKSYEDALYDATGLTSAQFQQNVKEYSQATFENIAIPDGVVTPSRIRSKLISF